MGITVGIGGPSGSDWQRDVDGNGNYLLNEQTTTNMMSKGTVYRLDGVNDFISADDLAAHLNNTNNTVGSVNWAGKIKDLTSDNDMIWSFAETAAEEYLLLKVNPTDYKLTVQCRLDATGLQWEFTTDNILSEDTQYDIRVIQNGVSPVLYVNGLLADITFSNSTDTTAWFHTLTAIDNGRIGCLNFDGGGNVFFSEQELNRFGYDNFVPTAAEVKDLVSGNLDFKWVGASQTGLVTGDDSDFDTKGNWVEWSLPTSFAIVDDWNGTTGGAGGFGQVSFAAGGSGISLGSTTTANKMFNVSLKAKLLSGTSTPVKIGYVSGVENFFEITPTSTEDTFTGSFMATVGTFYISMEGIGDEVVIFDDIEVTQSGAVALFDNTSVSETTWYNKAGTGDGAVTGAEVPNPPSVTPLSCLRSVFLNIAPGAAPGTNISVDDVSSGANSFNAPSLTDGTDIAKSGSSGSFALSADGLSITMTTTETVVGLLPASFATHDINSSSTTELYVPNVIISTGQIVIRVKKSGSVSAVDWTTIMDAGDQAGLSLAFITSTG